MTTAESPTCVASLKLSIAGRPIEIEAEVPSGPTKPGQLLPLLRWLTNEVVDIACDEVVQQGKAISCRAGCGACCRQLVPISQPEAYRIADLIERLPEPRRMEIRHRFEAAKERLADAGLLPALAEPKSLAEGSLRQIGMDYMALGIPCPFLEDESCSIHPDRPLSCREYLVTSPAEHCRQPTAQTVDRVTLPVKVSSALLRLERCADEALVPWVPLVLTQHWVEEHPEPAPRHTGPELMREVFKHLVGRELRSTENHPCFPMDDLIRPSS